jgi:sRNA-binding protein
MLTPAAFEKGSFLRMPKSESARLFDACTNTASAWQHPDTESGREGDEGEEGVGEVLEILGEAAVAAEPGEGSFNHPAARQHDEALHVVAPLDDLELKAKRAVASTKANCRSEAMPTAKQLDAIISILVDRFPRTFFAYQERRRPLKIGIHHDLAAALGEAVEQKLLHAAFGYYARNPAYLKKQRAGAERIDLDGNVAGTVTAEEAANAQKSLAGLRAKRKKKRETAQVEPKAEQPPQAAVKAEPPRRLGLADLKAAALKRKAQAAT